MVSIAKSQSQARVRWLRKLLLAALAFALAAPPAAAERAAGQPALVRALSAIVPEGGGAAAQSAATVSQAAGGSPAQPAATSTPIPAASTPTPAPTPVPGQATSVVTPVPGQIIPQTTPAPGQIITPVPGQIVPEASLMPGQVTVQPTRSVAPVASDSYIDGRDYAVLKGIPQTDHALGLVRSLKVKDSYFDRAVFVGDTITKELQNYVEERRKTRPNFLSNAQFLAADGFATRLALQEVTRKSMHPRIKGKKITVEEVLAKSKANKVFIMLGLNDVPISGIEGAANNMMTFVRRIRAACPKIEIYVQSAIPRLSGRPPTTQQLFDYNIAVYDAVKAMKDSKVYFVDVAYAMRNNKGELFPGYIRTEGLNLHLTDAACQRWLDYLYCHASPGASTVTASPGPSVTPSPTPTLAPTAIPAPVASTAPAASPAAAATATPEVYLPELPAELREKSSG